MQRARRLRVLIVPDKFKGTLNARDAARAIAGGWLSARPQDALEMLPMSDGGDGFGEILGPLLEARKAKTPCLDAAKRACTASWWQVRDRRFAVIESATVIGLAMLPPGRFHPAQLDTFGIGQLLLSVAQRGFTNCVIGLGGSATNDGGFGMARALGWQFLDRRGREIIVWPNLVRLATLRAPARKPGMRCVAAVDVRNPLLGPNGATRVYGPQKGLRTDELAAAEKCLAHLARVHHEATGEPLAEVAGSGAAGGLGFGLAAFAGARLQQGFDLFARHSDLLTKLARADLVITGEGSLDASTAMGKGAGRIALLCRRQRVPCMALGGHAAANLRNGSLFAQVHCLTDIASNEQAMTRASILLRRLARMASAGL